MQNKYYVVSKAEKKAKNKETNRKRQEKKFIEHKVNENSTLMDFLLKTLTNKSRNNIKSLLAHHEVLVDGNPISQFDFMLCKGDIVQISPSPVKLSQNKTPLKIIYEDDEFLAIDKPSGLLSVATDKEKTVTAYRLATDYVRRNNAHNRLFVVHRIDKDTSGVLLFVKNEELRNALQDDWNIYVKKREYIALVEGKMEKDIDTLISYLLETKTNLVYSSHQKNNGQKAITNYQVIQKNDKYSLLRVLIDTGRKNQIRVQLKDINHKVVGDKKYHSSLDPIHRLGLHAKHLIFVHPFTNKKISIISDTPKSFLSVFNNN